MIKKQKIKDILNDIIYIKKLKRDYNQVFTI